MPVCGTRRNREGTIITPDEPDVRADSRSDGRVAVRGNARPNEPHTGRSGDENPDNNPAGYGLPAPVLEMRMRAGQILLPPLEHQVPQVQGNEPGRIERSLSHACGKIEQNVCFLKTLLTDILNICIVLSSCSCDAHERK